MTRHYSLPDQELGLSEMLIDHPDLLSQDNNHAVLDILQAVRLHLKMEVAFVAEFAHGRRIFRYVDSGLPGDPIRVNQGDPLEDSYCQRVTDGRLPELIRDASENPVAAALPITSALSIGAHIGIPIRLADGSLYGTFCCFSRTADPTLNQRDISLMRVFADLTGKIIDREQQRSSSMAVKRARIRKVLQNDALSMVYQPIFKIQSRQVIGFESLARFSDLPERPPDHWFHEAHAVGLGIELEVRAIEHALAAFPLLTQDLVMTFNASPETIMIGALEKLLAGIPDLTRLVLEITEHAVVSQYKEIAAVLQPFRKRGLQIAIDDAGAGYASFRHILNLAPDRIKLDMSLTRDIDTDPARRALTVAFVHFARDTGSKLIAEGVETQAELATLIELGVSKAQGYFLGRPRKLQELLNMRQIASDSPT